jgi:hypothetical protein
MAKKAKEPRDKIRFQGPSDIEDEVELKIKRRFGRGLFVEKYDVPEDGPITIRLGNVVPKDVSDCRERDRVLNFITYTPVYTLKADPTPNGYLIDLPNRSEIYEGFVDRKQQIARRLDRSVANAIYEELVSFTPVENQLSGIKEILWAIREKQPVPEGDLIKMRGKDSAEQTQMYLQVLRETNFIQLKEDEYYTDDNLDAHDELEVESEEFSKLVLGQIVQRAYHTLKDELNLTLLAHYPKYAGSYYFSALKRDKPQLRLNVEAITDNLHTVYGDDHVHKYRVEKKLNELAKVGVVQREDKMFYGNSDVYSQVVQEAPV